MNRTYLYARNTYKFPFKKFKCTLRIFNSKFDVSKIVNEVRRNRGFHGNKRVNIIRNTNIVEIFTRHKRNKEDFFMYGLKFVDYN